ncbi:MAG: protein kinase [Deltaproteobacteria bacterium]|nr:protein kinase [Deltaproteobacteria bacterium]
MHGASEIDVTASGLLPARLPKGFEIDGVVVEGWLRDGGMAAIYRARRSEDGTQVALKVQLPSTAHVPEIRARFEQEAEAMFRVNGADSVVEVLASDVLHDGRRYFVMEWVAGDNLEEWLDDLRNQDQRLPIPEACALGAKIARGLAVLHGQDLVHRDLKPSNVMVAHEDGEEVVVKLLDFGIVADLRGASNDDRPEHIDESIMGTSAYMAPEQAAGLPPTPSFDLFALGVVLYEMLTGNCVPPSGWTPETLPAVETLRRSVPPALASLVRACMSSEPAGRPLSAVDVVAQLEALAMTSNPASSVVGNVDHEEPIRTGGTTLTPQSQIAAFQEGLAQRGGTEVALTHEQVLTQSGVAAALVRPGPSAGPSVVVEPVAVSPMAEPRPAAALPGVEAAEPRRDRPRWLPVLLLPFIVGAGWMVMRDDGSATQTAAPEAANEPTTLAVGAAHRETAPGGAAAPSDGAAAERSRSGAAEPSKEPSAAQPADPLGPETPSAAQDPSPPAASDEPTPTDPGVAPDQPSTTEPSAPSKPKPSGPTKAECEELRATAKEAKQRRDWPGLLAATRKRTCWKGSDKLARRRFRVEAFAETGNYSQCAKAAKRSKDREILARAALCNKKLAGAGASP